MSTRFRKSVSLGKGVKLNISKSSVGVSLGGKHGGVSLNSKNGARAHVSAPGTGLSYSQKLGGSSKSSNFGSSKSANAYHSRSEADNVSTASVVTVSTPKYPKACRALSFVLVVLCGLLCFSLFGIGYIGGGIVAVLLGIGGGLVCDYYSKYITDEDNETPALKKPIYKRVWVIVLTCCVILGFILRFVG